MTAWNQHKRDTLKRERDLENFYCVAAAEYDVAWNQTNSDGLADENFEIREHGDTKNQAAPR